MVNVQIGCYRIDDTWGLHKLVGKPRLEKFGVHGQTCTVYHCGNSGYRGFWIPPIYTPPKTI